MPDEWLPMPRYKLRKYLIRSILAREKNKGMSCLEIGYGTGDMLLMFDQMGFRVQGFDFSPLAYRVAKNKIGNRIKLIETEDDIERNAYDYLMALEVLEHIDKDVSALKRFGSYIKKNGKIILSVPAHMSKWGENDVAAGHYRRYERAELKKKLIAANFRPVFIWSYGYPLTIALDPMLHRFPVADIKTKNEIPREELSKESGIKRRKNLFNKMVSSEFVLFPFYLLQNFFLATDLGSGYIAVSEKI